VFSKRLIATVALVLSGVARASCDEPPGFLQGHLNIISPRYAEREDSNAPRATAKTYAEYALVIVNQDGQKEIAQVIADQNGNYSASLPPGTYILDVQDRALKRVRVRPQQFTVTSNQIVQVDMNVLIGMH